MEKIKAPGLKWIKRKASETPVWVADETAVKQGYAPKTVNLLHLTDRPEQLVAKCVALQADLNLWRTGYQETPAGFDGTIRSLLSRYQSDPESPYHALRPGTRRPYDHYLRNMTAVIGERRIDAITGIDLKRWHNSWSDGGRMLASSAMQRAILDAAVSFGIMCRFAGCIELREVLKAAGRKLPQPKRREIALSAEQVIAARQAAHADGRPSSALAYALIFETTLRLWDVIGQWWPLDTDALSEIHNRGKKWFGLRWENIGPDMVLRYTPSKTKDKTGRTVTYPLLAAPMVVEELAHWPVEKRIGPVIVYEATGLPYASNRFSTKWRTDRDAAGIPANAWARDLRASGISEGRAYAATIDDTAKVAGHSSTKTTSIIYDRANLEAAERFAAVRSAGRKK